jgi:hypothetical protein
MGERRHALTRPDLGATGARERWSGSAAWGLASVEPGIASSGVNPAMAEMDGVAVDEHTGRHVREVLPAPRGPTASPESPGSRRPPGR